MPTPRVARALTDEKDGMTISANEQRELEELDFKLRTILPEEYQDSYEDVQPVSMGSAGLKYADDGSVAWDEMWDTFCDLAMAGGPPHKGTLLQPGTRQAIDSDPDRYAEVLEEISRGVTMVTDLPSDVSPVPGWCRVFCHSEEMAAWLLRAIVMENVAARSEGRWLDLPAAPAFRLEKEIKNVVTVIAKTSHYWIGHLPFAQERAIAELFTTMEQESPLVVPGGSDDGIQVEPDARLLEAMAERVHGDTGLRASDHRYDGWLGVECPSVGAAVWMMRAMVVSNVLSRREGTVLFVPINPASDPGGERVSSCLARIHRLAAVRDVL
jgi:sirohydrochlorin cobaltochelatase